MDFVKKYCNICEQFFNRTYHLKRHFISKHMKFIFSQFICFRCKFGSSTINHLELHLLSDAHKRTAIVTTTIQDIIKERNTSNVLLSNNFHFINDIDQICSIKVTNMNPDEQGTCMNVESFLEFLESNNTTVQPSSSQSSSTASTSTSGQLFKEGSSCSLPSNEESSSSRPFDQPLTSGQVCNNSVPSVYLPEQSHVERRPVRRNRMPIRSKHIMQRPRRPNTLVGKMNSDMRSNDTEASDVLGNVMNILLEIKEKVQNIENRVNQHSLDINKVLNYQHETTNVIIDNIEKM